MYTWLIEVRSIVLRLIFDSERMEPYFDVDELRWFPKVVSLGHDVLDIVLRHKTLEERYDKAMRYSMSCVYVSSDASKTQTWVLYARYVYDARYVYESRCNMHATL